MTDLMCLVDFLWSVDVDVHLERHARSPLWYDCRDDVVMTRMRHAIDQGQVLAPNHDHRHPNTAHPEKHEQTYAVVVIIV